jgi:hypothetical protein
VPMPFQRRPPGHHSARIINEENPQTLRAHLEVVA